MSQHYFTAELKDGEAVTVLAGWDRPMQEFFLVIESDKPDSNHADSEGIIYSNLYDKNAQAVDWDYFANVLIERGIAEPEGLSSVLLTDRQRDAGNEITDWDESAEKAG